LGITKLVQSPFNR